MTAAPRYVGTDTASAVAYALDTWGEDLFRTYFDLDGDGLIPPGSDDERVFVRAVCAAETEVDEEFGSSAGAPFIATQERPIPDSIREVSLMRVPWCATRYRVMADSEKSSARALYNDAKARTTRLRTDNGGRITGPSTPPSVVTDFGGGYVEAELPTSFPDPRDPNRFIGF